MYKSVAFIPARSGSKRVTDKNIRLLNGYPLIAFSIRAAIESNIFDKVICATDSEVYAEIAREYGAEVPFLRKKEISGDLSADIDWLKIYLEYFDANDMSFEIFSILRPTSPFRTSETIKKAYKIFIDNQPADSLRAVQKCKEHPGKMWIINDSKNMTPLIGLKNHDGNPMHSSQYASLPEIYIQNASLEFAWMEVLKKTNTIAGNKIIPFISEGNEGFDINYIEDFWLAEKIFKDEKKSLDDKRKK